MGREYRRIESENLPTSVATGNDMIKGSDEVYLEFFLITRKIPELILNLHTDLISPDPINCGFLNQTRRFIAQDKMV